MPTTTHRCALSVLLASVAFGAAHLGRAAALPDTPWDPALAAAVAAGEPLAFPAQLPQRRQLTLAEAIMIAQGRYPGRVVRAQTIQLGNGAVHEIRIIGNDGLVHTVRVDAQTGAVK
jgi:hypothetical protein